MFSFKHETALAIVDVFENMLEEKGIEIPCEDKEEQHDRHYNVNKANLYGTEYRNLVNEIERLL